MTKEEKIEHEKELDKKRSGKYRLAHPERVKESSKKYYLNHKEDIKNKSKNYRIVNRIKVKTMDAKRYLLHKEERTVCRKKWYGDNKRERKEYNAKYRFNHKQVINNQNKERRATNPLLMLSGNLRNRTRSIFKAMKLDKPTKTEELLGADFKTVMRHIESQFIFGMSWENYGEWHIDHKKPLSLAKTEKQLIKLCHYTNLQPLWKEENLSKQAKTNFIIKEVRFG